MHLKGVARISLLVFRDVFIIIAIYMFYMYFLCVPKDNFAGQRNWTRFSCARRAKAMDGLSQSTKEKAPHEAALRVRSIVWKNQVADKLAPFHSAQTESAFPLIFPALFRRLQGDPVGAGAKLLRQEL